MEESELYNIQTCFNGSRCKLYDLATWKNGAAFKGVKVSPSGKPIIKIAELNNGISESTICTDEQFSEDILLHKGDLVFAWSGNPETSIDIFRYNLTDGWLNQHIFKVTVNEKAIDRDFFFYLMKYIKPNFKKIASNKQTTGLGHVTIADLKAITVTIPNHNLQRHIAEILKSLDDKIELNNRINHNLEEQAILAVRRFIFSDNISTMQKLSLSDVCLKITDGSHYSPKDELGSNIPMLSVKDMGHYAFDYSSCKHISESDYLNMLSNDCVPQIDDVLVAKDGSYLKELFINKTIKKQAILSSIAIFRPNLSLVSPELLLYILKQPQVIKEAKDNYVSGSALPRIVLKDFKKLSFNLPPVSQQKEIRDYLASTYSLINHNHNENERLIQSRDALIVKLMNKYTC